MSSCDGGGPTAEHTRAFHMCYGIQPGFEPSLPHEGGQVLTALDRAVSIWGPGDGSLEKANQRNCTLNKRHTGKVPSKQPIVARVFPQGNVVL